MLAGTPVQEPVTGKAKPVTNPPVEVGDAKQEPVPEKVGKKGGKFGAGTGELAGNLQQANSRMRTEVGRMMGMAAGKYGYELRQEQMMISSIDNKTCLAGAPVKGNRAKIKEGEGKLERSGGAKEFDKSTILGIITITGAQQKAVGAGSGRAGNVGSMMTGTYAVRGDAGLESRMVSLVGGNGKVVATVNIDPSWAPRKSKSWRPVYMSILSHFMKRGG